MPGLYEDADIQRVRDATDLAALFGERMPLKQKGHEFWCCCPFHEERTPSCKVDPTRGLWHCFGCGEGGDAFKYVMRMEGMSFPEALRYLAERANIDLPEPRGGAGVPLSKRQRLKEACAEAARFFHAQLMRSREAGAQQARDYLGGRGLGGAVPKRWDLGYAPGHGTLVRHLGAKGFAPEEMLGANLATANAAGQLRDRFFNRVMFPIRDGQGDCIAFGGRVIGAGEPKYLNSQETPIFHKSDTLYGLDKAKGAMTATGTAVVVEGYTDVIALHEAGVGNAVATLGTALTGRHIRLLERHARQRIVYLFDGDAAGQRAADRALGFIDGSITPEAGRSRIELAAVVLPDDLDPAEFVGARGGEALKELIDGARSLLAFGIERRVAGHDLSRAEGRAAAVADALAVLAPIKDSLLAKDYAVQIAGLTRTREEAVLQQLAALPAPRSEGRQAEGAAQKAPAQAAQAPTQAAARSLAPEERNRRRFEAELLGLLAQNPPLALEQAGALAQTDWHDPDHGRIACSLLASLEADPTASPASLVAAAAQACPRAEAVLTSLRERPGATAAQRAAYLAEELEIGDAEEAVAALKQQLAQAASLSFEESEALFGTLVALQKDLNAKRLRHKPLA